MTREEAVARIKDHIELHRYRERNAVKIFEALDIAIKALEQPEPCEDTISRQAAIDAIEETDWYHQNKNKDMVHGANSQEHQAWYKAEDIYQALDRLPSVQPERKKGKWLNDRGLYRCSCCKQLWTEWWAVSKPIERMNKDMPYCPVCGSYNGEELPSAQPEPCEDTISRQAAIDALLEEVRLVDGYYVENDEVINKDDAIEAIRLLPSAQSHHDRCKTCIHDQEPWWSDACDGCCGSEDNYEPSTQPEIIRCKDCKHFRKFIPCIGGGHYDGCAAWLDDEREISVREDDFCSYAERREEGGE